MMAAHPAVRLETGRRGPETEAKGTIPRDSRSGWIARNGPDPERLRGVAEAVG